MGTQLGSLARRAVLPAGLAIGAAVKTTVDFEKGMRNVNSIAQLSESQFQSLNKSVLELAGPTAQSPKVLTEGLYDLVSSGFDADESMQILEKSARAATAGLTTTEVSTKAVAAVLNAYRLPAKQAGDISDVLFRTVDRGVITFEELSTNIGDVLPFASSLGVDLRQVGASVATMTKAGISAPETMTRIKNVMVAMLKPSEGLKAAFGELGVSSGEALIKQEGFQGALEALIGTTDGSKESVAALFPNIRALGGALALTGNNAKAAGEDLQGMSQAGGATSRALSQQSKSLAFQWQRLRAQAEVLGIQFGSKLIPLFSDLVGILSDPKLTASEKIGKIFSTLGQKVTKAIPEITKAGIKAGAALFSGFAQGWRDMNILGKLLTAGVLI
ncbi:MAG: phage tail tape measure protein, partial [Vicinamibacteria bacterium]